jgi:hypothetical protein
MLWIGKAEYTGKITVVFPYLFIRESALRNLLEEEKNMGLIMWSM